MTQHLRTLGLIEGTSALLLFFVAMPLKYLAGMPIFVRVIGSAHGALFLAYVALAIATAGENRWPMKKLALALLASVLPFGPFLFDRKLFPETK
jgi:integral membrane protein